MTEKIEGELRYIPVKDIYPHPDNPRKDVGDITELAESIKQSGIMQNLTVVPHEINGKSCYRVIIGHRRLAAAKAAGLETVPCMVSDMDYKTQIATMLSENMQRVDLTIFEQVQGIQMMLDLGESVDEVAKKTGFSKVTVKKRAKIAALPADGLKAAEERGGTLEEYVECMKIDDEKKRSELLGYAGTRDFDWKANLFLKAQKREKIMSILLPKVKELAEKLKNGNERWSNKYIQVCSIDVESWNEGDTVIKDYDPAEKYFYWNDDYRISIYRKAQKQKSKPVKKSDDEIKADQARDALSELTKTAFELRSKFLENLPMTKENKETVSKYVIFLAVTQETRYQREEGSWISNGLKPYRKPDSGYYPTVDEIRAWLKDDIKAPIRLAQCLAGENKDNGFYQKNYADSMPSYQENPKLNILYEMLEALGYQISDDEKKLIDGTHEVFGEEISGG